MGSSKTGPIFSSSIKNRSSHLNYDAVPVLIGLSSRLSFPPFFPRPIGGRLAHETVSARPIMCYPIECFVCAVLAKSFVALCRSAQSCWIGLDRSLRSSSPPPFPRPIGGRLAHETVSVVPNSLLIALPVRPYVVFM